MSHEIDNTGLFTDPLQYVFLQPKWQGRLYSLTIIDEAENPPPIPSEVLERFTPRPDIDACKPPLRDR